MGGRHILLIVLAAFVWSASAATATASSSCPCSDVSLCKPLEIGARKEVFAFEVNASNWRNYDYDVLTTIVWFTTEPLDPDLLCYAHGKGVRVVKGGAFPVDQLGNSTAREAWIDSAIAYAQESFTDGYNVDIESAIPAGTPAVDQLTSFMVELRQAFRSRISPSTQVTYDVGWAPADDAGNCIDGRCYDFKGLADATDFLFVMAYDYASQIRAPKPCVALANSPFSNTTAALRAFMGLGIPADKLVFGLPWYGFVYECLNATDPLSAVCPIKHVPFRGVNCSDAAGRPAHYARILQELLPLSSAGRQWDENTQSPWFNYQNKTSGAVYQVRYDDTESLAMRYRAAKEMGLRGVGMWNADSLDGEGQTKYKKMWELLKEAL